jgi:excisionase family DNA binding protein
MSEHDSEHLPAAVPMLLTVEQAAAQLGLGRTTMYALIRDGEVESVQIGRLRRIRPSDLAAYISRLSPGRAA